MQNEECRMKKGGSTGEHGDHGEGKKEYLCFGALSFKNSLKAKSFGGKIMLKSAAR
jgi:hypothetical protein